MAYPADIHTQENIAVLVVYESLQHAGPAGIVEFAWSYWVKSMIRPEISRYTAALASVVQLMEHRRQALVSWYGRYKI